MRPPETIDVLDQNDGFTAVTYLARLPGPSWYSFRRLGADLIQETVERQLFDTLWRPGRTVNSTTGHLVSFTEHSFYQNNNDVTLAFYKVDGYAYLVAIWFDNQTGERIA